MRGGGPCGQYISNRDKRCSLSQQFGALGTNNENHKGLKTLPRFKGLGWGNSAFLGLVLVIDLLELAPIDAQAPLGQQVASQALTQAPGTPLLHSGRLFTSLIGHRFTDLKDR